MRRYEMRFWLSLILTLLLFVSKGQTQVTSQILEEIKRDFQPLSALIIGIEGNEVILDKGRAQGIKPKDILTVYKKIRKIVHPETKESLGFLKEPIGKIEVLRVDENFSTARILTKKEEFPIPTLAKRNTDIRILLLSEGLQDEALFFTLKGILQESELIYDPNLRLAQLTSADLFNRKIDLLLVVGPGYLKIYNSYLDLVRVYGSPLKGPTQAPAIAPPREVPPQPKVFAPQFKQVSLLGKMPGEVLQGEFVDLDGDGTKEMLYFSSNELFAVKLKGGLLGRYRPEKGQILSISAGPQGWIALNIYEKNLGMRSEIIRFTPQGFQPVIKNLNLILQFVDYAGTGQRDTLLVQTFDGETFYGREVYIAKREGNSIRYAQRLEVPENFHLPGANFVDLDGDGERELVAFLSDGRLGIFKRGRLVFSTPFEVSKHFYQLTLTKGKREQEVIKAVLFPVISPVIGDFDRDGSPDLLFVKAEFPLERVVKDLKSLPLNQGNFQFYTLSYQGTYYFRASSLNESGVLTALGMEGENIYFVTVKGVYPGQTESLLYSILY